MTSPLSVGLAGFGMAARVMHAPFLEALPQFSLHSVLERHRSDSLEKYPHIKLVREIGELVTDPAIELVVITTPNSTHYEYARQALLAGKHVVVEKPFTITSAEAWSLIELSRKQQKVLSVFQNRRYVCDFLTIRKILSEDLLGDVVEFEAHYDRYRPEAKPQAWREENIPGSGIFHDLGSHLIDQALFLFGIPLRITADIRLQRAHARSNDYFELWLDYGTRKIILKSGMLVREKGPRYTVHGTKGSFLKYGEDPQEELLKAGAVPVGPDWGQEAEENWGLLHTETENGVIREKYPSVNGNFGLYYTHLYDAIRNGKQVREKAEHGFNTIRMIELGLQSSDRKCTLDCSGFLSSAYQ